MAKTDKKTTTRPTVPVAVVKAAVKTSARPAAKRATSIPKASTSSAAKPAVLSKAETLTKVKRSKLVRNSFTMPKNEYIVLDELKQRAGKLASSVKKSELLRAGVKALAAMSDAAFLSALKAVPDIKTGQPTTE